MPEKIHDIDKIANECSDCGTCLFTCPVYNAELTEPNSPRGKVNIIKAIKDGRLEPRALNQKFIYQCALCGSCEHSCTKGVAFVDMMVNYRNEASKGRKIPFIKKVILYLYQSLIFRKFIWVADILAKTPLRKKLGIPRRRKANIKTLLHESKGSDPEQNRYDILFFPGCVLTIFYPEVIEKTVRLLKEKGFSVVIPKGLECCGFPFLSQGWNEKFKAMRKRNTELFSQYTYKYLVAPCGTGVMTFRNYYELGDRAADVYELTEFFYKYIKDAQVDVGGFREKTTWHDPCHELKSLGIEKAPRHFMEQLGENFVDDKSALCCGFGGIFSVGFPATSRKILNRKEEKLTELGVGTVVTGCPGCYMQLRERSIPEKDVRFFTDLFKT